MEQKGGRAADHKEQSRNSTFSGLSARSPGNKEKGDLTKAITFNNTYNYDYESDKKNNNYHYHISQGGLDYAAATSTSEISMA